MVGKKNNLSARDFSCLILLVQSLRRLDIAPSAGETGEEQWRLCPRLARKAMGSVSLRWKAGKARRRDTQEVVGSEGYV